MAGGIIGLSRKSNRGSAKECSEDINRKYIAYVALIDGVYKGNKPPRQVPLPIRHSWNLRYNKSIVTLA